MESAIVIDAEMVRAWQESDGAWIDAVAAKVEPVAVLNKARRVMRGIRYRPSCEMAMREIVAGLLDGSALVAEAEADYAIRVLRRFLKLSRAKRRASGVTVGGGRLRVSRWGE